MSVLVEGISLVIRRSVLDVKYPGGTEAFLHAMRAPSCRARGVCADDLLVSVIFTLAEDGRLVGHRLKRMGFVFTRENRCADYALVNQGGGLLMPCDWLARAIHPYGYTHAWLVGTYPGKLCAPDGWLAKSQPDRKTDPIAADENCRMRLAVEALETWLDFQTGEVTTRIVPHEALQDVEPAVEESARIEPLAPVVCAALLQARAQFRRQGDTMFSFPAHNANGFYWLVLTVDEERRSISCECTMGVHVPAQRRDAVDELLERMSASWANTSMDVAASDGAVCARSYLLVSQPACTTGAVHALLASVKEFASRHHDAVMRVAFGGMSPLAQPSDTNSPGPS